MADTNRNDDLNTAANAAANNTPITNEPATEAELITAARAFHEASQFHLRKSAEEFWRMGEVLESLAQRPSAQRRWRKILDEIGINRTSANQAQRLFKEVDLAGLAKYRNKTHALRELGILKSAPKQAPNYAQPQPTSTTPVVVPDHTPAADPTLVGAELRHGTTASNAISEQQPTSSAATDLLEVKVGGHRDDSEERTNQPAQVVAPASDPLTILAQIAARLEYLAGDGFDPTPEAVALIDRAAHALAALRAKGVLLAAA